MSVVISYLDYIIQLVIYFVNSYLHIFEIFCKKKEGNFKLPWAYHFKNISDSVSRDPSTIASAWGSKGATREVEDLS